MNVIVLHGTDTEKLYSRLTVFMNEAKKRGWGVTENTEVTPSLFGIEKLVINRDYKTSIPKFEGTLVIYHEGKIPTLALKKLNTNKVETYDLPVILWRFLDNMTVKGLHELLKTQAIEYIMAMIAWKLKQRYQTKPTPDVGLMINKLAEIDVRAKTGKADLLLSLDILLSKSLS